MITLSVETAGRAVLGLVAWIDGRQASKRGSQPLSWRWGSPRSRRKLLVSQQQLSAVSLPLIPQGANSQDFGLKKQALAAPCSISARTAGGKLEGEIVVSLYPVARGEALGLYPPTLALTARPFGDRIA
jgi:hypothetical protein